MNVGDWLRSLGLDQYEATFLANEVDSAVLPDLTDNDLEKLGVPMGHRKRLLRAIASLSAPENLTKAAGLSSPSSRTESAERRQLTVMFCDLVGSTAMSARLDPEDMREVIGSYHRCCASLVERNGGFVAKYMGDGVLAYFGYPQAHEHDAERAVRAGLAIVEAAPKLVTTAGSPLHVRVGIATGLVVVGDLIGSGESRERGVVGDTPNLAARLQGVAEPDTVVIAEGTRRLLGNLFEFQDIGAKELKGIGPARAWAALRSSSAEGRFEALHASGLTALIGREEEFASLVQRWSMTKAGEGRVALLSGEAGVGKSRLTAALLERLVGEPHTRLRYFCSPQHTDSALYPIISQMERAAGLAHDDAAPAKLDKLDAVLARTSTSTQDAALFAEMLSLQSDGRYPALELTPPQRRQRTLEALYTQIEALTRSAPVLMIFEDAHWADATSLEALGRTMARIAHLPVMLIVTFRSEFEPPWVRQPHVTTLTLNRLAQSEIDAMIDRVVGDRLLPASVRQEIVERTDGIPLFIEEMTKAVLEAQDEREARRIAAAIPFPAMSVPASLHASLMARLDRLGPAKEVAQIGAAIGREFSHGLLAAVVGKPEGELQSALDRLIAAGLLFSQGVSQHATYLFKHALVQDAAYGTLLREPRRALHARIADALDSQFTEIAESRPELLARHCTEAGLIEKAASLWGKAGLRSLGRSALVEATEQLTRAIDQMAVLTATPALRSERIKLQVALITPLMHVKGHAAPETKAAAEQARILIEQAEALGEPPEDPLLLFSVLYGFWVANYVAFKGDVVLDLAAQFLTLAEKQSATVPLMIGHRLTGTALLYSGDSAAGRNHFDQAIALYDPTAHRALAMRFGQDVAVAILAFRSLTLWLLGHPDAALADSEQSIKNAREIGQAATLMVALLFSAVTHLLCGSYAAAIAHLDEVIAFAEEKGAFLWKANGTMYRGCVLAASRQAEDAIKATTAGLRGWRSTGATVGAPFILLYQARAYSGLDQFDDARRCVGEALTATQTSNERWFEAEIHRIAGEIALASPERDIAKAEADFERALVVARAQRAKSWELRTATSKARLWRDQGKRAEARDLLAPIYGWFTEGFDTLDLREAKALLDALPP